MRLRPKEDESSFLVLLLTVTSGNLFNLSKPQFDLVLNKIIVDVCHTRLLQGLNKTLWIGSESPQ